MLLSSEDRFAVAVFGPTCAGKTRLGVSIAKAVQGEVISVDSLQCYKDGSVATAKPLKKEMESVTHHQIGYLEANEEPNDFVEAAWSQTVEITSRGNIPIFVGGSTSLTIPLLSEAFKNQYKILMILLIPDVDGYQARIDERLDEMISMGLLEEIAQLRQLESKLMGQYNTNRGVWKAIGYPELFPYCALSKDDTNRELLLKAGITSLKANTMFYAARQLEWIRHKLIPFCHRNKVSILNLPAGGSGEEFYHNVELPATVMAMDICHPLRIEWMSPAAKSRPSTVCIFAGASPGVDKVYVEAAKSLATVLHNNGIQLVYGGGTTGIMGAIASSLVSLSGPNAVHGIIPKALVEYEEKITGQAIDRHFCPKFGFRTIVKDMHSRKRMMIQRVLAGGPMSGFIALSGGYGTMEELLEITTWSQIGIHERPICALNVNGFFNGLLSWMKHAGAQGFIGDTDTDIVTSASTPEEVIECLKMDNRPSKEKQLCWV